MKRRNPQCLFRKCHDMTERLLKATLSRNQTKFSINIDKNTASEYYVQKSITLAINCIISII